MGCENEKQKVQDGIKWKKHKQKNEKGNREAELKQKTQVGNKERREDRNEGGE